MSDTALTAVPEIRDPQMHFARELAELLRFRLPPMDTPEATDEVSRPQLDVPLPYNGMNGRRFSASNLLRLMLEGTADDPYRPHLDPRWFLKSDVDKLDGSVEGETPVRLLSWKAVHRTQTAAVKDGEGTVVHDEDGAVVTTEIAGRLYELTAFDVFNAEQIKGATLPPPKVRPKADFETIRPYLQGVGLTFQERLVERGASAALVVSFYDPKTDTGYVSEVPPEEGTTLRTRNYLQRLYLAMHAAFGPQHLNLTAGAVMPPAETELTAQLATAMAADDLGLTTAGIFPEKESLRRQWVQTFGESPLKLLAVCREAERTAAYVKSLKETLTVERRPLPELPMNKDVLEELKAAGWTGELKIRPMRTTKTGRTACRASDADSFGVYGFCRGKTLVYIGEAQTQSEAAEFAQKFGVMANFLYVANPPQDELKAPTTTYLKPFDADDAATFKKHVADVKAKGAKYDETEKLWFVPAGKNLEPFRAYLFKDREDVFKHYTTSEKRIEGLKKILINIPTATAIAFIPGRRLLQLAESPSEEKTFQVPGAFVWKRGEFLQKLAALTEAQHPTKRWLAAKVWNQDPAVFEANKARVRALGGGFDKDAKRWFIPADKPTATVADLLEKEKTSVVTPVAGFGDARIEFGHALIQAGFVLGDDEPFMDGKLHRCRLTDDKVGQHSGAYKGYTDGWPAGYIENFRTGLKTTWRASGTGVHLSAEEIKKNRLANEQRQAREAQALQKKHEEAARKAEEKVASTVVQMHPTAYLEKKGFTADDLALINGVRVDRHKNLVVPIQDMTGKVWSTQTINAAGTKYLAAGGKKTGNFAVVGYGDKKVLKSDVILICEGFATGVSLALATERPVVAAIDAGNLPVVAKAFRERCPDTPIVICGDDDRTNKINKGIEKAKEAAESCRGYTVIPIFAPDETGKEFSDFNDLAQKSRLGRDAVAVQLSHVIRAAVEDKAAYERFSNAKQMAKAV